MKTRRTLKEKLLAVLLALAMLLPAVPNLGMVDTAEAASAYTLHEANAGSGDGDAYRFKSGKFMQIYVVRYDSGMRPKEEAYLERQRQRDRGARPDQNVYGKRRGKLPALLPRTWRDSQGKHPV